MIFLCWLWRNFQTLCFDDIHRCLNTKTCIASSTCRYLPSSFFLCEQSLIIVCFTQLKSIGCCCLHILVQYLLCSWVNHFSHFNNVLFSSIQNLKANFIMKNFFIWIIKTSIYNFQRCKLMEKLAKFNWYLLWLSI